MDAELVYSSFAVPLPVAVGVPGRCRCCGCCCCCCCIFAEDPVCTPVCKYFVERLSITRQGLKDGANPAMPRLLAVFFKIYRTMAGEDLLGFSVLDWITVWMPDSTARSIRLGGVCARYAARACITFLETGGLYSPFPLCRCASFYYRKGHFELVSSF